MSGDGFVSHNHDNTTGVSYPGGFVLNNVGSTVLRDGAGAVRDIGTPCDAFMQWRNSPDHNKWMLSPIMHDGAAALVNGYNVLSFGAQKGGRYGARIYSSVNGCTQPTGPFDNSSVTHADTSNIFPYECSG